LPLTMHLMIDHMRPRNIPLHLLPSTTNGHFSRLLPHGNLNGIHAELNEILNKVCIICADSIYYACGTIFQNLIVIL
jgi:hypothetical protein